MLSLIILTGKIISFISRIFNLGNGGTWPGEIALRLDPNILAKIVPKNIILVAGTNGKTTTTLMIKKILGKGVVTNASGANLLNGIVSAIITSPSGEWGVFEVDENSLPIVLSYMSSRAKRGDLNGIASSKTPRNDIVVFLNLFRDQLDRYGEVDVIAEKWGLALKNLPEETEIILNADDPLIAHLGKLSLRVKIFYFGLEDPKLFQKQMDHATDSIFCLNCGSRLLYEGIYYSHIGIWKCSKCGEKRPKPELSEWNSPLPGIYNKYNTLAAVSVAKLLGLTDKQINFALVDFAPAFGRQEEFEINGPTSSLGHLGLRGVNKKVKIFLSKNPAGFNESLRAVISLGAKEILFVLNDRIPDGRDVSWIWDVDFEMLPDNISVTVSGDRVFDMGLRIKYSMKQCNNVTMKQLKIIQDLKAGIFAGLSSIKVGETLYILPTYSAMLEVRKILKGRKIL